MNLLNKLSNTTKKSIIEPREIFMSLPQKNKAYEYPRDVQTEVWKNWFERRNQKNNIIKMNTGSGKTLVGLLILQSCLNEGKGPAVYVVPDTFLVNQVCEEARKIGISVTLNRDDYLYQDNQAILIMNVHALVNGKSVFGMNPNSNYPLGSVLIDDVHACIDTINSQFSLKLPCGHEVYNRILRIFEENLKAYDNKAYHDIVKMRDPIKNTLVPFWFWQQNFDKVYEVLSEYKTSDELNKQIYFNLPLVEDSLETCNCIITANYIEIVPSGINISKIKEFEKAERRIFMSATLSDDSVFISTFGFNENEFDQIITPENANDIGDRLILFPKHLNSRISNDDIKEKIIELSKKYNVAVIVPSKERAKYWDISGDRVAKSDNIAELTLKLKTQEHTGLIVFVNRYDGIDLPDDACRIIVIDSLPPFRSDYEKYVYSIDNSSKNLLRERIQKIEQGMGRGVRSNSDSCCVVLMGDDLTDALIRSKGYKLFSKATLEQYCLSKELWDLLKNEYSNPSVSTIFELADYSLNRDVEWIKKSRDRLSDIKYSSKPNFDKVISGQRKAFEFATSKQWLKALNVIDEIINSDIENSTKGYLFQVKASYMNFIDRSKAQEILLAGHQYNNSILNPIAGIQYNKSINHQNQAVSVNCYILKNDLNQNDYIIKTDFILMNLVFNANTECFESSLQSLGDLLGFSSTRPDKETNGAGPDNLWALGESNYLLIECKSGAVSTTISKEYCNQLGGSVRWFKKVYGKDMFNTPIMVHKSAVIEKKATMVNTMRIITIEQLEKLKNQVSMFVNALIQADNWKNTEKISILLKMYKLRGQDIIQNYTENPKQQQ
ncbi:DEAD/DEAH box helicase family protein [Clostridiaceae bacterium HFYG-1003]|nr:DEAD/DEAH box helicase family protein [Clostridiaceae bacterium HFYG-1003]